MKTLKHSVTVVLLLFVGATVATLVAQEVWRSSEDEISGGPASSSSVTADPEVADTTLEESEEEETDAQVAVGQRAAAAIVQETDPSAFVQEAAVEAAAAQCVVDAVYFHNTQRCHTCRTIEETARKVLEAEFSYEFALGQMRWSTINMEEERQYVEKYDLVKPTLILVRTVGDGPAEWVALDDTWTLVRHEARFKMYVADGARVLLERCP